MNNKIDVTILEETIDDLKNNPKACTIMGGTTLEDGVFTIPESYPGEQLHKFIQYFYENNLLDQNYLENNKSLDKKDINDMSFEEVCTKLSWIIRGDRFSSGLLYSCFEDNTILNLLERLYILVK